MKKIVFIILSICTCLVLALPPNFNLNSGRRLARYALKNDYTLQQIQNATPQQVINQLGITDPNYQTAIVAGWSEIQAECIRVWKLNNPTPEELTVTEIKAMVLEKWPDAEWEKVSDKVYTLYLEGKP